MKSRIRTLLTCGVLGIIATTGAVVAQETGTLPPLTSIADALVYMIPLAVPILIALAKKTFYTQVTHSDGTIDILLPAWMPKWSLPIIAPLLGILIDWILVQAGASTGNPLLAAGLGALGVWLREVTKPITGK